MFEDEEEGGFYDGNLNEDLKIFESYLINGEIGFLDSDRLEAIIDHYLVTNQYKKAVKCAEHALGQFSFNTLFSLRLAQGMGAQGQLKEALELLSKIEKAEATNVEILLTKASVFSQLRDSKNAIKYFKLALQYSDKEERDEIYLDIAMEYENQKDFKTAIDVLKEAIYNNPKNEGAIYEIAFCYDQIMEYDKAIKSYLDFIDENPYSFTAWYNLGNAYSKSENFRKAIWAYDYCIIINEDFGPVHFNIGNAYLSEENYLKAIDSFNKCMEIDGEDPLALSYIGEAYEQLGELKLAQGYYKQSIDLSPYLPDAWLGLGIVEDLLGNTRSALNLILKAVELDPENASTFCVLATAYEKLEEYDLALENYFLSLELDSEDNDCLVSYVKLKSKVSILETFEYLENKYDNKTFGTPVLLKVNLLWKLGRKEESKHLFHFSVMHDKLKSKELFDLFPELLDESELVQITDN